MELDDLKKGRIIDATAGKITKPIEGIGGPKKTLRESDPQFTPTERARNPARPTTIEGAPPPKVKVEQAPKEMSASDMAPGPGGFQVVQASFNAANMQEFDYRSLPKKEKEIGIGDRQMMAELDAAVEREKKSITERVEALTEAQRQELTAMHDAIDQGKDPRSIYDGRDPTPDDSEYHKFDNMDIEKLSQDIKDGNYNRQVPEETRKDTPTAAPAAESSDDTEDEDVEIDFSEEDEEDTGTTSSNETYDVSMDTDTDITVVEDETSATDPSEAADEEEEEDMTTEEETIETAPEEEEELPEESEPEKEEEPEEAAAEVELDDDDDEEPEEEEDEAPTSIEPAGIGAAEIEQDIEDEIPDFDDPRTQEEIIKDFAKEVKGRIGRKNRFDLRQFKIVKGGKVSPTEALTGMKSLTSTDWVYPSISRTFSCTGLTGPELLKMNPENDNRTRLNILKEMYGIIYSHITSPKPSTLEGWLKTVRFADLDHLFFGLFKATFADSNFMHYECRTQSCRHVYIQDIKFDDMVVYADEKIKKNVKQILAVGDQSLVKPKIKLFQATDRIVFGIRNPSIYNVIIETGSLSDEFMKKYNELIDMIMYIEKVYIIDPASQELHEVDMEPDPNSTAKTTAHRIRNIYNIMKGLSSTEYYELRKAIADTVPNNTGMTYQVPASKCPKCGSEIAAIQATGQELLFLRHQLGAYVVL